MKYKGYKITFRPTWVGNVEAVVKPAGRDSFTVRTFDGTDKEAADRKAREWINQYPLSSEVER